MLTCACQWISKCGAADKYIINNMIKQKSSYSSHHGLFKGNSELSVKRLTTSGSKIYIKGDKTG
jgi:hypothetical protein